MAAMNCVSAVMLQPPRRIWISSIYAGPWWIGHLHEPSSSLDGIWWDGARKIRHTSTPSSHPPILPSSHARLFVAQGLGTWEAPFELNVADPLCLGMHWMRWGWLGGRFQEFSEAAQLRKGGMAFGFNRCYCYMVQIRFQDFLFKKLAACDAMDCMCRWFVSVLICSGRTSRNTGVWLGLMAHAGSEAIRSGANSRVDGWSGMRCGRSRGAAGWSAVFHNFSWFRDDSCLGLVGASSSNLPCLDLKIDGFLLQIQMYVLVCRLFIPWFAPSTSLVVWCLPPSYRMLIWVQNHQRWHS